jgi:pimeloyl-ACP methyl ester carboxylesterase
MTTASFPTVLIQGSQDSERLRRGSEQLTELRPDIRWVQIPGGNHTFGTVHPFEGATPQLEEAISASLEFINQILAG